MDVVLKKCPCTLTDPTEKAWNLFTREEIDMLRQTSLDNARVSLHLTVGHELRHELGLWSADADELFNDISAHMPSRLVLDADMASDVLIEVLWHKARLQSAWHFG